MKARCLTTAKFVIIPDSFKGTMSSQEICNIMEASIRRHYPNSEIHTVPVADGGEGSVDSFLAAMGGKKVSVTVKGPFLEDMTAYYGVTDDGTAVIEMAACAGLPLVEDKKSVGTATTYGVGQLIVHAAAHGYRKIILGLGGSCTNDGGTGAAAAAGIKFYDRAGKSFLPKGESLTDIADIDVSGLCPAVKESQIISICDTDNPFYGPTGAAYIFGPQKGANRAMVDHLDQGLRNLAEVIQKSLGTDISELPGSGAAGGLGGGTVAFFGARLQSGIETVLSAVHFDELSKDADLILSGEGKIDDQSLHGKVVIGVAHHAKKLGVPLVAIVGDIGDGIESIYDSGVSAVFSINRVAVDFSKAKTRCKKDLALTVDNLFQFLKQINFKEDAL